LNRGRALLFAQRPGPPVGPPPERLSAVEVEAWRDILAAAPDVFRRTDAHFLELVARTLASWRSGHRDRGSLRLLYRMLGNAFMPMYRRRKLLFPRGGSGDEP
jgi:hypothetical protein